MAFTEATFYQMIEKEYPGFGVIAAAIDSQWVWHRLYRAQREIAEKLECIQGSAASAATTGGRCYDFGLDFIYIQSVEYGTATEHPELTKKSKDWVRGHYGDDWRRATGIPSYWYMEDARHFGVAPILAAGALGTSRLGTVYAYGPAYPTQMANFTAPNQLPTALDFAQVYHVCREIAARDPRGQTWFPYYEGKYQQEVGGYNHARPEIVTIEAPRRR